MLSLTGLSTSAREITETPNGTEFVNKSCALLNYHTSSPSFCGRSPTSRELRSHSIEILPHTAPVTSGESLRIILLPLRYGQLCKKFPGVSWISERELPTGAPTPHRTAQLTWLRDKEMAHLLARPNSELTAHLWVILL